MKLSTAKRVARLSYRLWQVMTKADRSDPLFPEVERLWLATTKERDRLEQQACERADKGVVLFEVFIPVYKGSAIRHVTRTRSRQISQTYWLSCITRNPERPTSPAHVDCHPYTNAWTELRRLNSPEAMV